MNVRDLLRKCEIPDSDISRFEKPSYWLHYFTKQHTVCSTNFSIVNFLFLGRYHTIWNSCWFITCSIHVSDKSFFCFFCSLADAIFVRARKSEAKDTASYLVRTAGPAVPGSRSIGRRGCSGERVSSFTTSVDWPSTHHSSLSPFHQFRWVGYFDWHKSPNTHIFPSAGYEWIILLLYFSFFSFWSVNSNSLPSPYILCLFFHSCRMSFWTERVMGGSQYDY